MAETKVYCGGCLTKTVDGRCTRCDWKDVQHPEYAPFLKRHSMLLDRYYVGRILTQSEIRVTYLAFDGSLRRVVSITEYLPVYGCLRLDDHSTVVADRYHSEQVAHDLKTFVDYARAMSTLDHHPNICPVLDVVEANGTCYVTMPFPDGISLKDYLAKHDGRTSARTSIALTAHVLDALKELHSHGILHRDLRPSNIMITTQGTIQVFCFGEAPEIVSDYWDWTGIIKAPAHLAEGRYSIRGKRGPWTDVYSVGAMLYECVTGVIPPDAWRRFTEDDLLPPAELCPGLAPGVNAAIMKALAVRAPDRFQTAIDFQTALLQGNGP